MAATTRYRLLLATIGVEAAEARSVSLMTSHAFFMGCATAFFETAASATFLARFTPSYLPWVYVAAAGVNTLTGAVYSRAQARVSFARLMRGTIWFLLAVAAASRLGLAISSLPWVAFAALVAYRTMSSLTDLEYWAVASRIYDVRQAKRLFGLIGTGEVVARIAASFSVPLLVRVLGVSNLMLLSVVGLGMCAVMLRLVLANVPGVTEPPTPKRDDTPRGDLRGFIGEILANPYLELVVGVAVLATFGKYFVDFAFLEQMSTQGRGEVEVAGILGIFSGLTQTLSLLTRLFVSRPLLHRFGIRVGVLVLPVLHVLCTLAILMSGLLGLGETVVFALVLGNQGVYKTFKHPIDNASFKVLYQPLKPDQRLAAQIAVEVLFSPVVVGASGGLMLLFTVAMPYDSVRFAIVMLVTFVAWMIAARAAGRRYGDKLREMLKLRIEGNVVFPFDDATTLTLLRERLRSPVAAEVCVALDLLEKSVAPDRVDRLVDAAGHSDPHVRQYAIERLAELSPESLRERWNGLVDDPAPAVRAAALLATTREGAVEAIEQLARSGRLDDRLLAVRVAGERRLPTVVRAALSDPAPGIRRAALAAAGRLGEEFHDVLVTSLRDPIVTQAAMRALATRGDELLLGADPFSAPRPDRLVLRRWVYVYRLVGTPAAIARLALHLDFPDLGVRARVIAALRRLRYVATETERSRVRHRLHAELDAAAWLASRHAALDGDVLAPLRGALEGEVARALDRIFALLGMLYDPTAIRRATAHLADAAKDKRAYAHELLEVTLEPRDRAALAPWLRDAPLLQRMHSVAPGLATHRPDSSTALRELITRDRKTMGSYTRALAIRLALDRDIDGLANWLRDVDDDEPIVEEIRNRALTRSDEESMLLVEKVLILKTVSMFADTAEELLAEIAAAVEIVDLPSDFAVFAKGDAGDSMYIVIHGRVRVHDGDETLRTLGEREIFGELALLDPAPRSASVTTIEETRLFRLDEETFSQLMAGSVEIVRGVLHVLCERLRSTTRMRVDRE